MYFACLEMLDESALKHSFLSSDLQMNHMGGLFKAQTFSGSNALKSRVRVENSHLNSFPSGTVTLVWDHHLKGV